MCFITSILIVISQLHSCKTIRLYQNYFFISLSRFLPCSLLAADSSSDYDCLIAIKDEGNPTAIQNYVSASMKVDKAFEKSVSCFSCDNKLTVYSPTDLDDYADVREYFNAAKKGVERALKVN